MATLSFRIKKMKKDKKEHGAKANLKVSVKFSLGISILVFFPCLEASSIVGCVQLAQLTLPGRCLAQSRRKLDT
jgi:hypothetical protein